MNNRFEINKVFEVSDGSITVTELSGLIVTSIVSQYPPSASSTALSSTWLEVEISIDGKIHKQRYERGHVCYPLKVIGTCDPDKTGSKVRLFRNSSNPVQVMIVWISPMLFNR